MPLLIALVCSGGFAGFIVGMSAGESAAFASDADASRGPSAAIGDLFKPLVPARGWKSIVLHHSATAAGSVESIDAAHRRQKDAAGNAWLGIGYHFVVGNGRAMADGEIQPTFRWRDQLPGAHAGKRAYNDTGIGICLIGNFEDAPPSERQLAAVVTLIKRLAAQYSIDAASIVRHRDVQATECPGRLFPFEQVLARAELPSGAVSAAE